MSKIIELWNKEKLPIKDGVYFSNGKSIDVSISIYPDLVVKKREEFDLKAFLIKFPEDITNIDVIQKLVINEKYQMFLGEGSYGSEGFIAYLTSEGDLEWVIYFERSNPFVKATKVTDEIVEVKSSANYNLIINVNEPDKFIVSYPKKINDYQN